MRALALSPDQDSYQLAGGPDTISVDYGGGAAAYRSAFWGEPSTIQVQWTLSPWGYTYLMAFYRDTGGGALPFLVDLVVDQSDAIACRALFVPGTLNLSARTGDAHVLQAQLQVQPPRYDPAADQAIIDAFLPQL